MDVLNRVRDMRTTVENDVDASRAALDAAISGRGRGRGRMAARGGALALGVLVVGGVVAANATGFLQPGEVPAAEAASTVLNKAAELQVNPTDLELKPGQFLRTTLEFEQVGALRAGWEDSADPFNEFDGNVIAAVRTGFTTSTYVQGDPSSSATLTESGHFHGIEALGDKAAAQAAWNKYYVRDGFAPGIGEAEPAADVWEDPNTFDPGEYSKDPQEFLDGWSAAHAKGIHKTDPAADSMWNDLVVSPGFYTAPAEYRATYLKALALIPGTEIVDENGDLTVIEYKSSGAQYRATIDTSTGNVTKIEQRLDPEKGVNGANPDGTRPDFLGDTFDRTTTITQEVVDSAPAVNSEP